MSIFFSDFEDPPQVYAKHRTFLGELEARMAGNASSSLENLNGMLKKSRKSIAGSCVNLNAFSALISLFQ